MQEGVLRGQGVGQGEGGLEVGRHCDFGELLLSLIHVLARSDDLEQLRTDLTAVVRVLAKRR